MLVVFVNSVIAMAELKHVQMAVENAMLVYYYDILAKVIFPLINFRTAEIILLVLVVKYVFLVHTMLILQFNSPVSSVLVLQSLLLSQFSVHFQGILLL